jgi:fructokinase
METWVSGPGLQADHARVTGEHRSAEDIAARAAVGDAAAQASLGRHASRLARGLAAVINIFDPEVIVLGGGLSRLAYLYEVLPALVAPYVLADVARVVVKPPVWGDAGGVRGAAWLWH